MNFRVWFCPLLLFQLALTYNLYGQLRIVQPNGGEIFRPGQQTAIRWEGLSEMGVVAIDYSLDDGQSWIGVGASASALQYTWRVPNTPSDRCRMQIFHSRDLKVFEGYSSIVDDASFNHDGSLIVSFGGGVIVKDAGSGETRWQAGDGSWAKTSPVRNTVVTVQQKTAILRNIETGAVIDTLREHKGKVNNARFTPDGSRIATTGTDGKIMVWDGVTGAYQRTLEGHTENVVFIRFSSDGSRAVTISRDTTLKVWDLNTGQALRVITTEGEPFISASLSPDGSKVAGVKFREEIVPVWDVGTGARLFELPGERIALFSPDGSQITVGYDANGFRIYNIANGQFLYSLERHGEELLTASYSRNGSRLVTLDHDGRVNVWNPVTGEFLNTLTGHKYATPRNGVVSSADFSPDGKRIVTSGADKTVRIWDLENLQQITDISDATFTIWPSTLAVTQIDMGTVVYGRSSDSVLTAVIRNPENQPLRVANLNITGTNSSSFSLLPDFSPIEVPAGGSADLKLRFTPSGAGAHEATLEMSTSATLKISLRGEGLLIPMLPQLDTIDFGPREMFREVDTTVAVVRNMTEEDIHIDSVTVRGAFGIWPHVRDTVLKAGAALSVRIECRMLGPYVDVRPLQIIYKAGDEDQDTVVLTVRGEGVRPASVGEERSVSRGVTVHPNPAGNRGTVEFAVGKASKVRMELWDVLGRRVQDEHLGELPEGLHRHELDLSGVGSGTYLLIVETASGRVISSLRVVR